MMTKTTRKQNKIKKIKSVKSLNFNLIKSKEDITTFVLNWLHGGARGKIQKEKYFIQKLTRT